MTQICYIDGRFVPYSEAFVRADDRGYVFADGVYEVAAMHGGQLLDLGPHLKRLQRSLAELDIPLPVTLRGMELLIHELVARNHRQDALLYIQITRGAARREHIWKQALRPVLSMMLLPMKQPGTAEIEKGVAVALGSDIRWGRCDIKAIALLPNVLARQAAYKAGMREVWMMTPEGVITEGSYSNSFLVMKDGSLRTHPANHSILGGITRDMVIRIAKKNGFKVLEQPFTLADIKKAPEAFLTSTTSHILPVVKVGTQRVGSGKPGPQTQKLMRLYQAHVHQQVAAA